jgi:hypothetical protein
MPTLQQLCATFTSRLHYWVGQARHFHAQPDDRTWIEKLLVFYALEDCQEHFLQDAQGNARKPKCRFAMGQDTDETKAKLQAFLKNKRADHLLTTFAKKAVRELHEFLLDFSLSGYSILEAIKSQPDETFAFLLIGESEMGSLSKVLEDFLKLTCIPCQFKVMVFKVRTREDYKTALREGFERVIHNARRADDKAEWLFVGIPGYKQWIKKWDATETLPKCVYTLNAESKTLSETNDWWIWET